MSKDEIVACLNEKKYDVLVSTPDYRRTIKTLLSLTYDKTSLTCWRAIKAIGLISRDVADSNPDYVRNLIGRLLWMIREESGGIGWSCPEILGEIVSNNPDWFPDVAPVIVSFIDEETLCAGVLYAIARIAEVRPELVRHSVSSIEPFLGHSDPQIRGLAIFALERLNAADAIKTNIGGQKIEIGKFFIFEDDDLKVRSVKEVSGFPGAFNLDK